MCIQVFESIAGNLKSLAFSTFKAELQALVEARDSSITLILNVQNDLVILFSMNTKRRKRRKKCEDVESENKSTIGEIIGNKAEKTYVPWEGERAGKDKRRETLEAVRE